MEAYKKELIETIRVECPGVSTVYICCDVDTVHDYNDYVNFMNKMTFDEIVTFVNGTFRDRLMKLKSVNSALELVEIVNKQVKEIKHKVEFNILKKEVANVGNTLQNTADVVNLFTDIEKNRTGLEEQIGKVNNRLDSLEHKIGNIEANINKILGLLQKS